MNMIHRLNVQRASPRPRYLLTSLLKIPFPPRDCELSSIHPHFLLPYTRRPFPANDLLGKDISSNRTR